MDKYYSADYVFPVSNRPVKNGVVAVDEAGTIINLYEDGSNEIVDKEIERFQGIIVPGFVNTHCHLELSYLHRKIAQKTGLISFIKEVIKHRGFPKEVIAEAIVNADKEMAENGIVAVGDISNTINTREVKLNSPIYYHTFVEVLSFDPEKAKDVFRQGLELSEEFKPLKATISPHSPYSVTKELFKFISHFCGESGDLISIHNQESEDENMFYRYKKGGFVDFYKSLNIDINFFKPQGRNSLQSCIPLLPKRSKILLVHNTYTNIKDFYFAYRLDRNVNWCFCPNANLYIEGRLPKIQLFLSNSLNITLGTDSLASNDKLCILSELKTLQQYFPTLSLQETIAWATLNGAKFLGIDEQFGSIEASKKPGLNLITNTKGLSLTSGSEVKKLI